MRPKYFPRQIGFKRRRQKKGVIHYRAPSGRRPPRSALALTRLKSQSVDKRPLKPLSSIYNHEEDITGNNSSKMECPTEVIKPPTIDPELLFYDISTSEFQLEPHGFVKLSHSDLPSRISPNWNQFPCTTCAGCYLCR